jgi:lipopolysaccharide/colanic/teichoic acid biosynthesis glycosyltransferase
VTEVPSPTVIENIKVARHTSTTRMTSGNGNMAPRRIEPYLVAHNGNGSAAHHGEKPWCLSRSKRAFDLAIAIPALIVLSPVLLLVALAIVVDSPGPVFFRQWRTGYKGKRFRIYKFRTMRRDADQLKESLRSLSHHGLNSPDFKIKNDPRVTRAGRHLRRLSLDEVPNLINVLLGDMSLVGPRPTTFDVDRYADWHLARLAVPSGMTGLWQISGRSDINFDARVQLDCRYIKEQSIILDLKILVLTPFRVLGGRGAY